MAPLAVALLALALLAGASLQVPSQQSQVDDGEAAFGRVFRETGAYYLLGVEPVAADRDGRLREVEVKVRNLKDTTVRSRNWVIVPKK
jgi:hypothetical protein